MKKWAIGAVLLVILIAVAVMYRPSERDTLVKQQLEQAGTKLLGVPVTVDSAEIDLEAGSGEITGLRVANPEGYQDEDALNLKLVRIAIDPQSMSGQTLVLNKVEIDAPAVNLEVRADGSNNLQQLQNNIEWNTGATDRVPATFNRIAIRQLTITGGTFTVDRPAQQAGSGTVPTVSSTNFGGSNGATLAETGRAIVSELTGPVLRQALQDRQEQATEQQARDALKGLGGLFGKPGSTPPPGN